MEVNQQYMKTELVIGRIYYLRNYTAPKVYCGTHFECLLTDQIIDKNTEVSKDTKKDISEWDSEIYNKSRFNKLLFERV